MKPSSAGLPTDDEVRRLLRASTATPDARAAAAVTIVLSLALSLSVVRQLRWSYVRQKGSLLQTRSSRAGSAAAPITQLLCRQLWAIGLRSPNERIFAKPAPESQSLDVLFQEVLVRAGLADHHWNDFVLWSRQQSPETKLQVATPWGDLSYRS